MVFLQFFRHTSIGENAQIEQNFTPASVPPTFNPPLTSLEATSVTSFLADFQKYLCVYTEIDIYLSVTKPVASC